MSRRASVPRRPPPASAPWAVALALGLVAPTACAVPAAEPAADAAPDAAAPGAPPGVPPGAETVLTFADVTGPGAVVPGTEDLGTDPATVTVTTAAGGRVVGLHGPEGMAVRFPAVSSSASPAAAALVLRPTGSTGLPSPGERELAFGADVVLDPASEGAGDQGDNVVQRGRYLDDAQLKLQVDHGLPSCRVVGSAGEAFVVAEGVEIRPGTWYRLACSRRGAVVRITVQDRVGDGWSAIRGWSVTAVTGRLDFPAGVPVSVGAKVDGDGRVSVGSTDQLSGAVDNVFVDVGR